MKHESSRRFQVSIGIFSAIKCLWNIYQKDLYVNYFKKLYYLKI